MDDTSSQTASEATPEPEGPPQGPTVAFWESDTSLSSTLDYSKSPAAAAVDDGASSVFSNEDKVLSTLNRTAPHTADMALPTLQVARLVQELELLRENNADLRQENKLLVNHANALEREKEEWTEARMTADLQKGEAQQKCDALQQELEQERENKDATIQELQAQIASLEKERDNARGDSVVNKEAQQQVERLQRENESLEKQLSERRTAAQQSSKELEGLQKENKSLQQQVSKQRSTIDKLKRQQLNTKASMETQAAIELEQLKAVNTSLELERNGLAELLGETRARLAEAKADKETPAKKPPTASVGVQTDEAISTTNAGTQTEHLNNMDTLVSEVKQRITLADSPSALPISERLVRIRDAAERASLVKEHQQELSKLKSEQEAEIQALQAAFEEEKEGMLKKATLEMNAGYEGLKQRLQDEHAEAIHELEQRHFHEKERMKKEAAQAAASAAESIDAALAQAASTEQTLEREQSRRESLEVQLNDLQREIQVEKQAMEKGHNEEMERVKSQCRQERADLIDTLHRECNLVFEQHKSGNTSPRSISTEFFVKETRLPRERSTTLSPRDRPSTTAVSPSFSEIDRTLRETEAMVAMVMNGRS